MSINSPSIFQTSHRQKFSTIIPAKEYPPSLIGRHVDWLKRDRGCLLNSCVIGLIALEVLFLAVSIVGIIPLKEAYFEANLQKLKRSFNRKTEDLQGPSRDRIEMKSKLKTFNHTHDFAIESGVIWVRDRPGNGKWSPLFFDGDMDGKWPIEIDCDGANLIVIDNDYKVHYKKVLREYRGKDVNQKALQKLGIREIDPYVVLDKAKKNNWKRVWFTLPVISRIVNLFTEKRLDISHAKAWSISHRGLYNDYLNDRVGQSHPVKSVTTLYVLDVNGKDLHKFDPWSPMHIDVTIPLPESSNSTFVAENISASSSTIMVIGYETQKQDPTTGYLKIYTRLADIDSEGWNPGFKYGYFKDPLDPEVCVVPLSYWQSHPIELEEGDFITKDITIFQTGEGNLARELRVAGKMGDYPGFYFKNIRERHWQFEPSRSVTMWLPLPLERKNSEPFVTTVFNYKALAHNLNGFVGRSPIIELKDFGKRSYHSKLHLKLSESEYILNLYKKKTLKNFLGFKEESYDLVIPQRYHKDERIMLAFNGKKVIPLHIWQEGAKLSVKPLWGSFFQFVFLPQDEQCCSRERHCHRCETG